MAGIYVKNNGTWKLPKSIWVKSGGWKVCKNVYVKSGGAWREMISTVTLSASKSNFNLWNYLGSPTQPVSLIFNINANVRIFSEDVLEQRNNIAPRTPAFTVGNFPAGSTILINNNGYISGGGGFGGSGANKQSNGPNYPNLPGARGGDGSYGITKGSNSSYDCTVVNTGTIAGGGGGGGGSGGYTGYDGPFNFASYGYWDGGDGAGITAPSATVGQSIAPSSKPTDGDVGWTAGNGRGGNCGKNGQPGWSLNNLGTPTYNGGAGGLGKFAIHASGIEVAVSGTILGGVG